MVADSSGEQAFFTNREEAVEAAFAFMTPEQRQKAQALVGAGAGASAGKQADVTASETGSGNQAGYPNSLWEGRLGNGIKVTVRRRNTDGNYEASVADEQVISLSPYAFEEMTGNKPDTTGADASSALTGENPEKAEALWHTLLKPDHLMPNTGSNGIHKLRGHSKAPRINDRAESSRRGIEGENIVADVMAEHGYSIEQVKETLGSPDLKINNNKDKCDVFSPAPSKKMKGLWDVVTYKVDVQNAPYVIINIDSQGQDVLDIKNYFNKHRISGLKQLFVVKNKKLYIVF